MRPSHAGTFHVTARSVAEEHIFRDDRDYRACVQIIAELTTERFLVCHGFCLMPTHYHLLASFDDEMLTPAVRRLNRRYAGGFNWRHGRRGHVFDSPYVSVEVRSEAHAYRLPDYIAENPPYRPWPWSSYDVNFPFVRPLPWLDELESGSADTESGSGQSRRSMTSPPSDSPPGVKPLRS
jgi:REP element-mobilizing transposase RayT